MNYLVAVDDCFIDSPGGMARVAWDIAVQVRNRGHHVTMFCGEKPIGKEDVPSEVEGIEIVRYTRPVISRWDPRRASRLIAEGEAIARQWIARRRWDVVHIHSPFTGTSTLRAIGDGPRYVYTMHSPAILEQRINWGNQGLPGLMKLAFGQGMIKRMERRLLQKADVIHALSYYTRDLIERFYGLADRVTVIPHWCRPEMRRSHSKHEARNLLGWPQDQKILFTVRHHGPRIGLDVAIQAIGPLARQDRCHFMIAGDGRLRPKMEKLAKDLGVADRIIFLGRVSDEVLSLAYEAADLFVLPTLALECFGLIILEAFAFGCPVISTDAGAIPETMKPIMPDFVVPAGNVTALTDKIDDFLNGKLLPPSPQKLVEYVFEKFGISVVVPQLLAIISPEQN
jgi:glycosyltransferase involved in cell wall biosynthesis